MLCNFTFFEHVTSMTLGMFHFCENFSLIVFYSLGLTTCKSNTPNTPPPFLQYAYTISLEKKRYSV